MGADRGLKTLTRGSSTASRLRPASGNPSGGLNSDQRRHAAGLMRINHTGEVCAQALYPVSYTHLTLPTIYSV